MVEHSASLISKILKASNRHFSFDGWYGPAPPIVMSQQWPAPANPLRGEMNGVGISDGLCLDLRDDATLVRVHLLRLRPTRGHQFMTWYDADSALKRCKWEQVTSESDLMSLSCRFIAVSPLLCLCLYYYFCTPLHSPAWVYNIVNIFFYFCLSSSLSALSWWADLELIGQDWSLLRWKERKAHKNESKT